MAIPGHIDLNDLLVFEAVAQAGGFTAAAERLGVATAKVSLEVGRLEAKLGLTLFNRTTRKVVLTDAGQALYEECQPLLHGLIAAVERAGAKQATLSGSLRISSTVDHAAMVLAPALALFAQQHPRLSLDLRTSDRIVDMLEEGIDVSIRIGWLRDSSLRAVKLGAFEQYVMASPQYVQRHPPVRTPQDLADCDWVALSLLPTPLTWQFSAVDQPGAATSVRVKSRIRVDSASALRALLQQHVGVSVLDQLNADEAIQAQLLVRLLPQWRLPEVGIYAVYPPGRQIPGNAARFIAYYQQYLRGFNAEKQKAAATLPPPTTSKPH